LDGQGIFGPAVDVAVMGADGLGGDDHAFEDRMGIRLQDAAIHESAGIALVGVAEDVFDVAGGGGGEFPFQARGEAGPAAAAKAGIEDFFHDLVGGHLRQGLGHPLIAVPGDVFLDPFRIDEPPVAEDPQLLEGEEGNLLHGGNDSFRRRFPIEESFEHPSFHQMLFHKFRDVFRLDGHVNDAFGIDDHDGAHGAETVASRFDEFDFLGQVFFGQLRQQSLLDADASGSVTARAAAEQ